MKRSALATAVALAACAFSFEGADLSADLVELQLTPAGDFQPSDGRPMQVSAWRIDAAIAARVIDRFKARGTPPVVDYEHQTLNKETNGQPAPAAAWIRDLVWKEGKGLYAQVDLTQKARAHIQAREYLFVSPVFSYHPTTGEVLAIEMAALTNTPAIDGMEPLALRAAATFGTHLPNEEDPAMNKLLIAICTLLGLKVDSTTEDQAIAALNAFNPLAKVRTELGLAENTGAEEIVAACSNLKTQAAANKPDPAKYVPIAALEEVKTQLASLTKDHASRAIDELVKPALADGRLLTSQEDWARELGAKDIVALTKYLETAQPIAALRGSQTGGKEPPVAGNEHKLSASEIAVCTAAGIDQKAFAAAKVAQAPTAA